MVQQVLAGKKQHLADVMGLLDGLKQRLNDANARKEELSREVESCTMRLDRAQQLTQGLAGEKRRWATTTKTLQVCCCRTLCPMLRTLAPLPVS